MVETYCRKVQLSE